MNADHNRGLTRRVYAGLRNEVPAEQLEAFRRAGSAVFELQLFAEEHLAELAASGRHPWDADASSASLLLCTWTARLHQTFAAELLDADYQAAPRTAGFLPPVTAQQAWAFFEPVGRWLNHGRRAAAATSFWIGDEEDLPSALPELFDDPDAPGRHLRGLLTAADAIDRQLEESLGVVICAGDPPARWSEHLTRIRELAAQAQSSLRYAQALWHPGSSPDLDRIIRSHLHPALVLEHHVGQFLALPELLDSYRTGSRAAAPRSVPNTSTS